MIEADTSGPSPANANKLIHVVGPVTAQASIQDSDVRHYFHRSGRYHPRRRDASVEGDEEGGENVGGSTITTTTYDYSSSQC
jgi:hypothetical protein